MTPEHLAEEADRLLNDDVLQMAFMIIKGDALQALATVDADNKTDILRQQAKVAVIDDVLTELHAAILRVGEVQSGDPVRTIA